MGGARGGRPIHFGTMIACGDQKEKQGSSADVPVAT